MSNVYIYMMRESEVLTEMFLWSLHHLVRLSSFLALDRLESITSGERMHGSTLFKREMETDLSVLLQVVFERLDVVVEAELRHREQNVFSVDRLALLLLTSLAGSEKITTDAENQEYK